MSKLYLLRPRSKPSWRHYEDAITITICLASTPNLTSAIALPAADASFLRGHSMAPTTSRKVGVNYTVQAMIQGL